MRPEDVLLTHKGIIYQTVFKRRKWLEKNGIDVNSAAEDAVANAYLRVLKNKYDPTQSAPTTFLVLLTKNFISTLVLSEKRKRARQQKYVLRKPLHDISENEKAIREEDRIAHLKKILKLRTAVGHLPREERKTIRMIVRDKLSNDKIAKKLGKSIFAVKKIRAQGIERIKRNLLRRPRP